MPYLLAALLLVKRKRCAWVSVCMALAYCNSFYYAPAMLAVLGWYWLREEGTACLKPYVKAAALSAGMAAALLIPTGLVILEHRRSGAAGGAGSLLEFQWDFTGLLYTPYGMGLTLVCLYALFLGLGIRRLRADSICYLCVCGFAVFPWLLNATLYARDKILIPFVPLVVLHCVRVFRCMEEERRYVRLLPFAPLAAVLLGYRGKQRFGWVAAEMAVLFFVTAWMQKKEARRACYLILLVLPACFCLKTARTENYVSSAVATDPSVSQTKNRHWEVASVGQLMAAVRFEAGEEETAPGSAAAEIGEEETAPGSAAAEIVAAEAGGEEAAPGSAAAEAESCAYWRTESLYEPLDTANRYIWSAGSQDAAGVSPKGSMYSSVTNAAYAEVWYDLLLTPIQINNRVALLPADNPFLLRFMGVRYVQTAPDQVPDGYRVTELRENSVLAENGRVLPVAYLAADYMDEAEFDRLDTYAKLDALMRTTVADGGSEEQTAPPENGDGGQTDFESRMRAYEPEYAAVNMEGLSIREDEAGGWEITAEKGAKMELALSAPLTEEILLLSFSVERKTADAVVIDINGIRNKLSGKGAAYPNGNNEFHYQFSEGDADGVSGLTVEFTKGKYRISNVQWHTYAKENLYQKQILPAELQEPHGDEILSCVTDGKEDSLFVTSVPRQRGMELLVDGVRVPLWTVNKAFAGAVIPAGHHEVRLVFRAPGLRAGYAVSALSLCLACVWILRERRKRENGPDRPAQAGRI